MTERQTRFFRALLEPFPDHAYKTTPRGFTYVKARTIMTRLDDIAGPMGWTAEYTETKLGHKCRLKICCPDHTEDGVAWHHKEDGAGREDMGQYVKEKDPATGKMVSTDEWETDTDNDEKSAYTNAFRRAAAAWGFGRELYGEGVPRWLLDLFGGGVAPVTPKDEPPPPPDGEADGGGSNTTPCRIADREPAHEPPRQPTLPPRPPNTYKPPGQDGQRRVNLTPPRSARGLYPWLKSIEEHFRRELVKLVNAHCTKNFGTWNTKELDDEQAQALVDWVIAGVKTWDNYEGEFDEKEETFPDRRDVPADPRKRLPEVDTPPVDNRGSIKKAIVAAATAWIMKQTGRAPSTDELMAGIGEVAAGAKNGRGVTGEVLGSLRDCDDKVWLANILAGCQEQVTRAARTQPQAVDDDLGDIPF